MIRLVFCKLWQFETRHKNARNLHAILIVFLFQIQYVGVNVKSFSELYIRDPINLKVITNLGMQ